MTSTCLVAPVESALHKDRVFRPDEREDAASHHLLQAMPKDRRQCRMNHAEHAVSAHHDKQVTGIPPDTIPLGDELLDLLLQIRGDLLAVRRSFACRSPDLRRACAISLSRYNPRCPLFLLD